MIYVKKKKRRKQGGTIILVYFIIRFNLAYVLLNYFRNPFIILLLKKDKNYCYVTRN